MINYGYFRHRFDAHTDVKIMNLRELGGLASVACYFILLEIYGKHFSDDAEKKTEQVISSRHIANSLGLRLDSTRTQLELMSNCKLIDVVWLQSAVSSVKVCVPSFSKYFGSYKKTGVVNTPNKRKEKERKEKESKSSIKINGCYPDADYLFREIFKKYPIESKGDYNAMLLKYLEKRDSGLSSKEIENAFDNYLSSKKVKEGYCKGMDKFWLEIENWIIKKSLIEDLNQKLKEECNRMENLH